MVGTAQLAHLLFGLFQLRLQFGFHLARTFLIFFQFYSGVFPAETKRKINSSTLPFILIIIIIIKINTKHES